MKLLRVGLLVGLVVLFVGCKGGGSSSSGEEDTTCWAHTAADLITVNEMDNGEDVYQVLVDHFGKGVNNPWLAAVWFLDSRGFDSSMVRRVALGDLDNRAYWLFEDGMIAVGFMFTRKGKNNHSLTAYEYGDIEPYKNRLIELVYIKVKEVD